MNDGTHAGLTTEIPMTFRRRAGKAVIVLPNGERAIERREALIDNTMVKLIARGHRWHRKLFDGTHLPPLKRGGVDNASNVQWQTIEAAKIKILHGFCPSHCGRSKALWVWALPEGSWRAWHSCLYTIIAKPARLKEDSLPSYEAWVEVWVGF